MSKSLKRIYVYMSLYLEVMEWGMKKKVVVF